MQAGRDSAIEQAILINLISNDISLDLALRVIFFAFLHDLIQFSFALSLVIL